MKIEDTSGLSGALESQKVQKNVPAFELFKAYGAAPSTGADQAQVSAQAQEIHKYAEQLKALPDIREDRVQTLEQRLDSGTYQVALDDVSEMMFRMAELDQS